MEDCLKPVIGVSQDILRKNQIRKGICRFFPKRECYTMVRPVDDEADLANIENLEWDSLKNDFKQQCNGFISDLRSRSRPKELHGKVLNSQMLLGMAMDFCDSVNADGAPKIDSSVQRLIAEETRVI